MPAGCVVLNSQDGGQTALKEIQAFVDERVAPYKRLRGGLYAFESLPKGSTGKLLRRELPGLVKRLKGGQAKL